MRIASKFKSLIISSLIGFPLLYLLFRQLEVSQWLQVFADVKLIWLLMAFLLYLVANFSRTVRVWLVFKGERFSFFNIFNVLMVHNLVTSLLPSRTGEVSFIYLLKKVFGISYSKNTYLLLFLRLLDMIVVFSFFILSLVVFKLAFINVLFYFLFIFFLVILIFYLHIVFKVLVFILSKTIAVLKIKNEKILKLLETLSAVEELRYLKKPKLLIALFTSTIIIWLSLYTGMSFMVRSLGFNLNFNYVVFGAAGVVVTSFLPISGLGGFGGAELGWSAALILYGIEKSTAIPLSFGIHVINLIFAITLGLFGIISLRLKGALK